MPIKYESYFLTLNANEYIINFVDNLFLLKKYHAGAAALFQNHFENKLCQINNLIFAPVAELADAYGSGPYFFNESAGSIPVRCTKKAKNYLFLAFYYLLNYIITNREFAL